MNQVSEESKSQLMKTLAVIGFAVLIVLSVWLAVKIVQLAPGAFSSLATMAENVQLGRQAQNQITIESTDSVVNANESFVIAWSDIKRKGYYTLDYECVDGVTMDVRVNGDIIQVECDSPFVMPADIFSVDAVFSSNKDRFVDVPYRISFIKEGESETAFEASKTLTIVNASVSNDLAIDTESGTTDTEDTRAQTSSYDVEEETDTTNAPVQYRYVTTYTTPASDPYGYTDLEVTYVTVGVMTDDEKFVPRNEIDIDEVGAIQFKVKNISTKTSIGWQYIAELPSGTTFQSKIQNPLKPNEHAIITIAFEPDSKTGSRKFSVRVTGGSDTNTTNNNSSQTVRVVD